MPTLRAIAEDIDLSHVEVHALMGELGINWKSTDLKTIRTLYIRRLRARAAGQQAADGTDLVAARAVNERLDGGLKKLALAEKRGLLVSLELLEPELSQMVGAFKTDLIGMADKLKAELDAIYGIDIQLVFLEEHIRETLRQLARYAPGRARPSAAAGRAAGAGAGDVDDRVGKNV